MKNYTHAPVPHVFQINIAQNRGDIDLGDAQRHFTLRFCLIGSAIQRLAPVAASLVNAAYTGIGKHRVKATLRNLEQIHLNGDRQNMQLATLAPLVSEPEIPPCPGDVKIQLHSPYKPPGNRKPEPDKFDLSAFLMGIVRRIDLLSYFHTGNKLQANFAEIKAMTLRTDLAAPNLIRSSTIRYSASHREQLDLSGLTGSIDLHAELVNLIWPFLYTGQYLNVGKNASMGLGQYSIQPSI